MSEAALIDAARRVFAPGATEIDPAYILPADRPLELSGEAIRTRLCTFTDARGAEWVMRPDLTLPVADAELQRRLSGAKDERVYAYAARAFRLPAAPDDPLEFTQVGFERFGALSNPDADVALFTRVLEAVDACDVHSRAIMMGDLAIVPAFIEALGLPDVMQARLKRAFRQDGGVRALLDAPARGLDAQAKRILASADPAGALTEHFSQAGFTLMGARSADEIVEGLSAQAAEAAAGGIPARAQAILHALGSLDCAAGEAPRQLDHLCAEHSLKGPHAPIAALTERLERIGKVRPKALAASVFRASFGRRFTYYDGFLFEVLSDGLTDRQPVAAGGRYDGLIAALSNGRVSATALGGVVRPDRLLRAKAAS